MSPTPEQLARAYGCPIKMAACMAYYPTPLLTCVMKLGPVRVHWMDDAKRSTDTDYRKGEARRLTPWSLDGKQATIHEILRAAGAFQVEAD